MHIEYCLDRVFLKHSFALSLVGLASSQILWRARSHILHLSGFSKQTESMRYELNGMTWETTSWLFFCQPLGAKSGEGVRVSSTESKKKKNRQSQHSPYLNL